MLPPIHQEDFEFTLEESFRLVQIKTMLGQCEDLEYLRNSILELTRQNIVLHKVLNRLVKNT